MTETLYIRVILDMVSNAVDRPFQYLVPIHLRDKVKLGSRVLVPFRSREMAAYVVAFDQEPLVANVREILGVQDFPLLLTEFVELSYWLSQKFFSRWIEAIRLCLPPAGAVQKTKSIEYVQPLLSKTNLLKESARIKKRAFRQSLILENLASVEQGLSWPDLRKKTGARRQSLLSLVNKGLLKVEKISCEDFTCEKKIPGKIGEYEKLSLTAEQKTAWEEIKTGIGGEQKQFLIYGITGSGKTELYLRAAEKVIRQGRNVLFLVPEIALTTQMIEQLKIRFPGSLALLHSNLSQKERYEQWLRVKKGKARIVLGARSCIFAPLNNIGLIIMDEEHENTYKQSESPRYHTRDVAKWRAAYHDSVLLMGSATPSLETFLETKGQKVKLTTLTKRVKDHLLPSVKIVDMRREFKNRNRGVFSRALRAAMEETLSRGEQIMLFLNRRGFSSFLLCRQCGFVMQCPYCDVSLTYHLSPEHLQCHYCGYRSAVTDLCPKCKTSYFRSFGLGTQRVEKEVKNIFPQVETIRMDSDTTAARGAHFKIWSDFKDNKASILIGTQMIAKGFDFPKVTLVGIVAADITLHLPDFRAGERTFQLLSQAAGRTGRGKLGGRVIIQTFTPWHYSIKAAAEHSYMDFLNEEFKRRKLLKYPPFSEIILINCSSPLKQRALDSAKKLKKKLTENLTVAKHSGVELMGPSPAPLFKIKDRFRYHLIYKGTNLQKYAKLIRETIWDFSLTSGKEIRITVDFDPLVML
ncbi:MAG: primosomal protein N' [Firmicutes bacterium]|nr:primosomal protein N' [Bacillota bacterium]